MSESAVSHKPQEESVILSEKSSTLRAMIIAPLALLAFPGCQTGDGRAPGNDVVITRITAEDTSGNNADIVVSTQEQGEALMFDPAQGEIAYDQINLVGPNGQRMGMTEWLSQLEITQGVDVDALTAQEFTLASSRSDAVAALVKPAPQASAKQDGAESNLSELSVPCCYVCERYLCFVGSDLSVVCYCTEWWYRCDTVCGIE
jgi:hypothetical protein